MASTEKDRVILAGLVFAVLLSQVMLYPGVADLVTELGVTSDVSEGELAFATQFNAAMWFLSLEFIGYLLFVGLWGLASDRVGRRKPFIVIGAFGGTIGYLSLAIIPTLWAVPFEWLLILRFLQGALTIGAFSLGMTMLMDLKGGHGRNMGAAGIAIGLGAFLGAAIGGALSAVHPFAPLYGAGALLFLVGLGTTFVTDRAPERSRSIRRTLSEIVDTPVLSVPFAFGFIDRFTAGFFALIGVFYFEERFGLSGAEIGLMLALFFLPFALLQYPLGRLSDRIGRTYPVVIGSACYGIAIITVGLLPSVALAAVGMVVVGVLGALVSPATMALVTDLSVATDRATSMSGFNFFGSMGFLGGFLIGGTVTLMFDFTAAFLVAGGLEIAIALVTIPVFLRLRRQGRIDVPSASTFD